MKCDRIRKILHDYIDGELDREDRRVVEDHLGACAECKRIEEKLRKIAVEPFEKAEKAVPPERVWNNIREAITKEAESRSFIFARPKLAFATAGLAVLVACVLILANIYLKREDPVNSFLNEQMNYLVALGINGEEETGIGEMDFGTNIEKYLL
ncbi:MAG: anti-sigma factor family protein [Candidatus Omnitrophota bacterium]